MKKIVVLSGSIREGRKSHFVAQEIYGILTSQAHVEATLLDLKSYPFPIMEKRMNQMDELPDGMQLFSDTLFQAQGIVIVSPEYKNGMPGALKNALDYLNPQIFKRIPLAIVTVSSGGFGGLFCLSQLRGIGLALGGVPIPEKLCISKVNELFDDNGEVLQESFKTKSSDLINSFLWYVDRLSS